MFFFGHHLFVFDLPNHCQDLFFANKIIDFPWRNLNPSGRIVVIGRRPRSSKLDRLPPPRPMSAVSDRHMRCIPKEQAQQITESPAAAALGKCTVYILILTAEVGPGK